MLVGLAIMALGALWAGWELLNRPRWLEVTSLRPKLVVVYWVSLKQGVDYRMPFEFIYTERLNENNRWLVVAGVVTGLGLLTVGLSPFFSNRRKAVSVVRPVPGKRIPGPGRRSSG